MIRYPFIRKEPTSNESEFGRKREMISNFARPIFYPSSYGVDFPLRDEKSAANLPEK
jgi:hypothetical protein